MGSYRSHFHEEDLAEKIDEEGPRNFHVHSHWSRRSAMVGTMACSLVAWPCRMKWLLEDFVQIVDAYLLEAKSFDRRKDWLDNSDKEFERAEFVELVQVLEDAFEDCWAPWRNLLLSLTTDDGAWRDNELGFAAVFDLVERLEDFLRVSLDLDLPLSYKDSDEHVLDCIDWATNTVTQLDWFVVAEATEPVLVGRVERKSLH